MLVHGNTLVFLVFHEVIELAHDILTDSIVTGKVSHQDGLVLKVKLQAISLKFFAPVMPLVVCLGEHKCVFPSLRYTCVGRKNLAVSCFILYPRN